jgi:hypothetical protein
LSTSDRFITCYPSYYTDTPQVASKEAGDPYDFKPQDSPDNDEPNHESEDAITATQTATSGPPESKKPGDTPTPVVGTSGPGDMETTVLAASGLARDTIKTAFTSQMCPDQGAAVQMMSTIRQQRRNYHKEMTKRIANGEDLVSDGVADMYKAAVKESFQGLSRILMGHRHKLDVLLQLEPAVMADLGVEYEGTQPGRRTNAGKSRLFWEWVLELGIEDEVTTSLFGPGAIWELGDLVALQSAFNLPAGGSRKERREEEEEEEIRCVSRRSGVCLFFVSVPLFLCFPFFSLSSLSLLGPLSHSALLSTIRACLESNSRGPCNHRVD